MKQYNEDIIIKWEEEQDALAFCEKGIIQKCYYCKYRKLGLLYHKALGKNIEVYNCTLTYW